MAAPADHPTHGRPGFPGWLSDGFLAPVRVLSPAEAATARRHFNRLEAEVGIARAEGHLADRHFDQRFVWDLATSPRVLDAVESLIGADLLLLATRFFCKYATAVRGERFVAWHQDATYWGLEPPAAVSAWIAIDASGEENGCLRVIPGSHSSGLQPHGRSTRSGNMLTVNQEVASRFFRDEDAVAVPLEAGEMSIHHSLLLHSSLPNQSDERRCGLAIRFAPPRVRQVRPATHGALFRPFLVRGRDVHGHFPLTPAPFPP